MKGRILFLLLLLSPLFYGQQTELTLQKRDKISVTRKLPTDMFYEIKFRDSVYTCRILERQGSELVVLRERMEQDTTEVMGEIQTSTRFYKDTLRFSLLEISWIEKDWFRNRKWMVPALYGAMFSVAGILFLPVAALSDGKSGVMEWARFEAIIGGFSFPQLFIGTRKKRFDLQKQWEFAG